MSGLHAAIVALALTGAGAEEPVLLDFSASWCRPCRSMEPVIDKLIAKGYRIRKLDFDRDREVARKYQVSKIPCFVMLVGGRETSRILGTTPIDRLEAMFAEARSQMPTAALPEPKRLPDEPGLRPMPSPGPIPLPQRSAPSALAMESTPGVPAGPAPRAPAPGIPAQPVSISPSQGPRQPGAMPGRLQDKDLIAVTVRLRVHDAQGPSTGTGTIIDARGGKALILTCGHIFREYREGGLIEVELFNSPESQSVEGRLLSFDDKRDVGLLMIDAPGPLQTAKVASKNYAVDIGAPVVNLGCNHGDPPSVRRNRVTARDKYLGPPNIEVGGLPVQGRSGGGLFSSEGLVIGVCNAADPEDNEGLYAALPSIHQQLDDAGLSFVYADQPPGSAERVPPNAVAQAPMVDVAAPPMSRTKPVPDPIILETGSRGSGLDAVRPGVAAPLASDEQRLMDELLRRQAQGAEIVCIVRPKGDPESRSEVFVFENASPALVERLTAEGFTRR
ncbi:MAG: hypothetical protein GXY25_01610 [Pirellulaceae bacterium]|jgi:thiol-disulfide isomerase/thioredoxin|nr:thioredoxin domain-containing protein [Thermoguttaceae bacterium]MDI9446268.1 thioredoxin domain-containing protein [Planctomycetota bacterium]NLY99212.1 hypothetical protein [Pirellulaceae bacterium]